MRVLARRSHTFRRLYSSLHSSNKLTIGIRREDPQRIWERRCPLTPEAVSELVEQEDVRVLVQPCERRVWTGQELLQAGAEPHENLAPAHIVVGIKETPLHEVLTDALTTPSGSTVSRTHLMFSHTHKGQHYNMELLSKFLEHGDLSPRLIDYELLTDEEGRRTVGFGWYAGVAGALESLSALAHALLEIGVASPFLSIPRPHSHPSLPLLLASLRSLVGDRIASDGTPTSLGPIVIGVTGSGKVSQGCLDLLEKLPIQHVRVEDLAQLVQNPETDLHKIYVVHATPKDYFIRTDGQPYNREHYYANPHLYESVFHERIAPYLTLLMNGAGWAQGFPRLMNNVQLAATLEAAQKVGKGRFVCVGDISCDIEGGLEYLPQASTLSSPFFRTRPKDLPAHLPSITMMSVDILPTALSRESSMHFSNVLMPYLRTLIKEYKFGRDHLSLRTPEDSGRLRALEKATVASHGRLRDGHQWLEGPLGVWKEQSQQAQSQVTKATSTVAQKKKVLLLGSGMVAGPAVDEIASHADTELLVASNSLAEAKRLTSPHENASACLVDMARQEEVAKLIGQADVVVSLLPVPFHPSVAELCVKHKKHLVTASYISPNMRALHERAQAADILLLNEIGLDPGIDHCSAISLLSHLSAENKRVVSFTSFCGGLPAPEDADVPLKYKFSWSPRGVLSAALNGARFKLGGQIQEIAGKDILKEGFSDLPISDVLKLEGIANRDSLPYAETYSLGKLDSLRTIVRGTLRYPGFSALMHAFKSLGLLEPTIAISPGSWIDLTRSALEAKLKIQVPNDVASLRSAIGDLVDETRREETLNALHTFGILPGTAQHALPPSAIMPSKPTAPLDLFAAVLADKLHYGPGERDLVLLYHEIVAQLPSTGKEELHTSSLVVYGDSRASAMARTVGLPLAFAVRSVLDGSVKARGVCGPGADKAVWTNVLQGLQRVGLGMQEKILPRGQRLSLEESLIRSRG
ncbi:Saccharopine dehydrogenase-domain-containing protein [Irpex rosettiformis]|uniref:Saccharopine dehydrogenase-domain-containing protein n=1 Tax=Irpex rosettiformis TaxID=378272 RepID=A0ACB8TXR6_9APHY|nr:Saccharopine dehydrogenase-domain-containing protein [Irpex rosettiformis]